MAEKDTEEKLLEDYNDVFADIVNVLLFDGKRVVLEDDLENTKDKSQYKADGNIHEQERDVSKIWNKTNIRIALLGLENQTSVDNTMPFRVIGYDGAEYRAQLLNKKKKTLYPVITLVLYFGYDRHWSKHSLYDCMEISNELKPFVSDYHINVFEIAYLPDETVQKFTSDFRIVADYFVQMRKKRAYETYDATAFTHPDEILKLMSILDGNQKFENAINAFKTEKKGVTINMIDVFEQAEERAESRGIELAIIKLTKRRLSHGKSAQEIADDLDEDPVLIQMIISAINACSDNASDRDIYNKLHESE